MTWNENEHPRDGDGKFTKKEDGGKATRSFKKFENPNTKINNKITKQDYKETRSLVMDKISLVRKQLERTGNAIAVVVTWDYIYNVKINNDDEFSYEILSKRRND